MTAAVLAQVPRQSAILTAVAMLHVGVFIIVAGDKVTRLLDTEPIPPIVYPMPRVPDVERPVRPAVPEPAEYVPETVPRPEDHIPRITHVMPRTGNHVEVGAGTASSGYATSSGQYLPPTLDMRDSRISALIDSCYPPSARRLGNEGRAQVKLVIDAEGRATSWSLDSGTGFFRLDSAVDCVVGRLKFQPARRDGRAVVAELGQAIVFRLN